MRFVLLHYHLFKNAGTTIENILDQSFGECFARMDTPDRDGQVSNADLIAYLNREPHVRAVSSHQFRYPVPAAPGFLFFPICFLRDPLDRIRSIYDYYREKPWPGDPYSDLAVEATLGEFLNTLIEQMPHRISNVQTKFLADEDIQRRLDDGGLQRALDKMLQTSFLGVVDCFNESLTAAQYLLHPFFPRLNCNAYQPTNSTRGLDGSLHSRIDGIRQACDPQLFDELVRLNEYDSQLLNFARRELHWRVNLAQAASNQLSG